MKIAVSASEPKLDAAVDPRFGRCAFLVVVDPETMAFEVVENENAGAAGGAGIRTAQAIADKGVDVVLTGNCGPNAYETLSAAGIKVITGVSGRVADAVRAYDAGSLRPGEGANVADHYGVGGRGGMGRGAGRGRGVGLGQGMETTPPATDAIGALSRQMEKLSHKLDQLSDRLMTLERDRT
jgi:predicted Fe-Mo cluster-binding NifX family protein